MAEQGNRQWKDYNRTKDAQAFAAKYAADLGVPVTELVKYEESKHKGHGGVTWVRRRIALHFLGALSPGFANWAFGVIERYIDGKITTEESKAAQVTYDALLEDGRIKYEQLQKRLTATENELEAKKGGNRRLGELLGSARDEAEGLRIQLNKGKKKDTKKSRAHDKFEFVQRLREAIKLSVEDRTVSTPEAEEGFGEDKGGLPMTIPKFVQGLEEDHKNSDGLGKDWSLFNETPGHGWNIIPLKQAVDDTQLVEDFCKYTNFVAGFNHPDKKKVLQEIGDEMFAAPVSNKRARRC